MVNDNIEYVEDVEDDEEWDQHMQVSSNVDVEIDINKSKTKLKFIYLNNSKIINITDNMKTLKHLVMYLYNQIQIINLPIINYKFMYYAIDDDDYIDLRALLLDEDNYENILISQIPISRWEIV